MSERWRIEPDYAVKVDPTLGLLGVLLEPTALARADRAWLSRLISRSESPVKFAKGLERAPDDIKVIVQFAEA